MAITAHKLLQVLEIIECDTPLRGVTVFANGGGELAISMAQPPLPTHKWLLARGFITNTEGEYIYRPRIKS